MKKRAARMKKTNLRKKIPAGVKAIAIVNFVYAGLMFFSFVTLIAAAFLLQSPELKGQVLDELQKNLDFQKIESELAQLAVDNIFLFVSLFAGLALVAGIISLILGIYLWKGRNWARMIEIVLAIIALFSSVVSIFDGKVLGGVFWTLVYLVVIAYLSLNKEVRKSFH